MCVCVCVFVCVFVFEIYEFIYWFFWQRQTFLFIKLSSGSEKKEMKKF